MSLFHSERDVELFFNFLNIQHPNIHFTMEKEANRIPPFLDVIVNNTAPLSVVTTTGLLTNYFRLAFQSYRLGLAKTSIDKMFKINNTWQGFHNDIQDLVAILRNNLFLVSCCSARA